MAAKKKSKSTYKKVKTANDNEMFMLAIFGFGILALVLSLIYYV
jgi:hypothetical protein